MDSESHQLHIFFLPFMAQGHMIPLIDMAKLFAMRNVKATIIATDLMNVPLSLRTNRRTENLGYEIDIVTIKFPFVEAGMPEGCNILYLVTRPDLRPRFFKATAMLKQPLEQLLEEHRPDCLIADMFFPWATDAAAKFGIPRIVFHGTGFFSLCATECVRLYEPHKKVSSDTETFVIPHFPSEIKLTRNQLPNFARDETDFTKFYKAIKESELSCFGVIVNSFYELEPAYANYYRKVLGRKAWHVGPVSLCNRDIDEKAERGEKAAIDEHECLKWLDFKKPNSVVYICFGSIANFYVSQLLEIAMGLEASGQQFIWVVNKAKKDEQEKEEWLPEGFEKTMEGKGLIIRGWAPQVLILEHEAIGGFVTHCGWNSTLEGVSAGVPMVTWPLSAEQFYNEKLVTQVLGVGVGVGVGVQQWVRFGGDFVKREAIDKLVREILVGDKAEEIRNRAKALKVMANKAVEKGGSSYSDLNALIEELSLHDH